MNCIHYACPRAHNTSNQQPMSFITARLDSNKIAEFVNSTHIYGIGMGLESAIVTLYLSCLSRTSPPLIGSWMPWCLAPRPVPSQPIYRQCRDVVISTVVRATCCTSPTSQLMKLHSTTPDTYLHTQGVLYCSVKPHAAKVYSQTTKHIQLYLTHLLQHLVADVAFGDPLIRSSTGTRRYRGQVKEWGATYCSSSQTFFNSNPNFRLELKKLCDEFY